MPVCAAITTCLPDGAVVPDMNQIVDLRAAPNPRLSQRSAVDRRIRSNLNIVLNHQPALLRKDQVLPRLPAARIAKSRRAQHGPRLHDHAVPQHGSGMHHHTSHQVAIAPDRYTILQHDPWADPAPYSNRHSRANHRRRVHTCVKTSPLELASNHGKRIPRVPHPQHPRIERQLRILETTVCKNRPGLRLQRLRQRLLIQREHNRSLVRALDARDLRDLDVQQRRAYSDPVGDFAHFGHQ